MSLYNPITCTFLSKKSLNPLSGKLSTFIQQALFNCQLSTVNCQLSTVNCQPSLFTKGLLRMVQDLSSTQPTYHY
ncbi:MAG: hypothetical protein JGK08_18755 [Microcoleus sp. PH2017_04_SCI_O_A]|nr:hypothetical protein [Microcoleus sp. PH2017_04_SCI_O_A]